MRILTLPLLLCAATAALPAQRSIYSRLAAANGDRFGMVATGDLNGDGFDDGIVGAWGDDTNGVDAGSVTAINGRNGQVLWRINGGSAGDRFGLAVAGGGDANADGYDDVVVGSPREDSVGVDSGTVRILSGLDGSVLVTVNGRQAGDNFGAAVIFLGDVTGDGRDDIIASGPGASSGYLNVIGGNGGVVGIRGPREMSFGGKLTSLGDFDGDTVVDYAVSETGWNSGMGRVHIFSSTGTMNRVINGTVAGGAFGGAMTGTPDMDGNGQPDIVIAATRADNFKGIVYAYSMPTGALLWSKRGKAAGDRLGFDLASTGDVDGDGRPDVLAGATQRGVGKGYALVLSGGRMGRPVLTMTGSLGANQFGRSVSAPFVTADGHAEFFIGAIGGAGNKGAVEMFMAPAPATPELRWTAIGDSNGDKAGASVAIVGDMNGDSIPDMAIGAPADDTKAKDAGSVRVVSGLDGSTIWTVYGQKAGDQLGFSVADAGDANGDGTAHVIVGAPQTGTGRNGYVQVHGPTGGVKGSYGGGAGADAFGSSVTGLGDVSGNGKADFAAGASAGVVGPITPGYVQVLDEAGILYQLNGTTHNDQFGTSVGLAGDVNHDSIPDLIVGASQRRNQKPGYARVYQGRTGALLRQYNGQTNSDGFGISVAGGGDIDLDGTPDQIVGAPLRSANGTFSGAVSAYSGASGALIRRIEGGAGQILGWSVANAGDVDGDGFDDVVLGAPGFQSNQPGFVQIYSFATNRQIGFWPGIAGGAKMGTGVAGGADINRDGRPDIAAGAPDLNRTGPGRSVIYVTTRRVGSFLKTFGSPCTGSTGARQMMRTVGLPRVGDRFLIYSGGGKPSSTGFLLWGLSRTQYSGLSLPFDLSVIGGTGCSLLVSAEFSTIHNYDASGTAGATLAIPNTPSLIKSTLFFQWLNLDTSANNLGITSSEGLMMLIGEV